MLTACSSDTDSSASRIMICISVCTFSAFLVPNYCPSIWIISKKEHRQCCDLVTWSQSSIISDPDCFHKLPASFESQWQLTHWEFHRDRSTIFWLIVFTLTDRPTDRPSAMHNVLRYQTETSASASDTCSYATSQTDVNPVNVEAAVCLPQFIGDELQLR